MSHYFDLDPNLESKERISLISGKQEASSLLKKQSEELDKFEPQQEDENQDDEEVIDVDPIDRNNNIFKKIGKTANKVVDKVGIAFNKTTGFVKETVKTSKSEMERMQKTNDRNKKLAKLLPFLDDESIHELVEKILSEEESTKGLDINLILPYLSEEDADRLLIRELLDGETKIRINKIAPFVSDECMRKIADLYIEGKIPSNIRFEDLLPFLDEASIKKIFQYEIFGKTK